jgi:hypothetical protein
MRLLTAGVDTTVIALWLGHESVATTLSSRSSSRCDYADRRPASHRSNTAPDDGIGITTWSASDAMHTQTDTATAITGAGGDYVFTVKASQPGLYADCKRLPWRDVGERSAVTTGHGRRVWRTINVVTAPA